MTSDTDGSPELSCSSLGWKDGLPGMIAGSGAGLCCAGPLLFGALGMSGIAGGLASMPFVYHVILQWIALAILAGSWTWFVYKWFQIPVERRWTPASIIMGLILTAISLYVIRSWATHVLI